MQHRCVGYATILKINSVCLFLCIKYQHHTSVEVSGMCMCVRVSVYDCDCVCLCIRVGAYECAWVSVCVCVRERVQLAATTSDAHV